MVIKEKPYHPDSDAVSKKIIVRGASGSVDWFCFH